MGDLLGILFEADLRGFTVVTLLKVWEWPTGKGVFVSIS